MFILVIWMCFAVAGGMIGAQKGAGARGFWLGLFLGPIGLLLAALMSGNRARCPFCREMISADAKICPRCRSDLSGYRVE